MNRSKMLRITYLVQIGDYQFRNSSKPGLAVEALTVSASFDKLTRTAKITIPRTTGLQQKPITDRFKVGDRVVIKAGYDYAWYTAFVGYVSKIRPNSPLEFECEDEMWKLKQKTAKGDFANLTLAHLVGLLHDGETAQYENVNLGKVQIKNANGGEILDKITKDYGLRFFFKLRDETPILCAGRIFENVTVARYNLSRNVASNDLEFQRADDVKISIKAINRKPDGTQDEATVGDEGGQQRTRYFYNTPDFKKVAEAELDEYRFNGYRGGLTAFGFAYPQPGQAVEITDPKYPERAGRYYVESSELTLGSGVLRVKIGLGKRAS